MKPFRWGILGTGYVARKFALGLRAAREMGVGAVASRSGGNARAFASALKVPAAFASYEAAVREADVDAFYIATPPTTHRDLALMCIRAGKPVLVEKPFAENADAAGEIIEAARATKVFCMEAMWTRFLPAVAKVKALIEAGALGDIHLMTGSFGLAETEGPQNALFDPALGGGALLDRAVYPLSLAFHLMGAPSGVTGETTMTARGVDAQAALTLRYPNGALATLTASLRTAASNDFVIMGSKARIRIDGPIYRPSRIEITPVEAMTRGAGGFSRSEAIKESGMVHGLYQRLSPLMKRGTRTISAYYAGNGYHYEALEVMRCVRAGQSESALMPLDETQAILETIDMLRVGEAAGQLLKAGSGRNA